jgi:hypothetical protein
MIINATDIKMGKASQSEVYHFTGGLCAHPQTGGAFLVGPVGRNDQGLTGYLMAWPDVLATMKLCGCQYVGSNQTIETGKAVPTEVWRSGVPQSPGKLHAADSWGAIAHQAHAAKDPTFSDVARYLSVSLQAAGVRLRDVARAHHDQLSWALWDECKPDHRFANMAMTDLYLAFQSLASELCSARDHLARIAGMGCGAEKDIDSMVRLEGWLKGKAAAASTQLPSALLAALGPKDNPGWLRQLGTVRNEMVHRQPMAANPGAAALRLSETITPTGVLRTIRLVPMDNSVVGPDPFEQLVGLYNGLESLAIAATAMVPHKPELPLVVGH